MDVRLPTASVQRLRLTLSSHCLDFTVLPAAGIIDVYLLLKHLFALPVLVFLYYCRNRR